MASDFYKTLGVSRDAGKEDLKKAYRKLAVKYHPDKNPGDKDAEKKFKEISAAYDILKDDQKRAAYDQFGDAAFNGGGGSRAGAGGFNAGGFDFSGFSGFSDIFDDLFSGGGRGGRAQTNIRGSDLRYNLDISLEDAFAGKQQTITIATHGSCDACHGSGSADKGGTATCNTCAGQGRVRMQQGFFTVERTCSSCHGTGRVIKNPCKKCHGQGRVKKQKTLSVNIPEGVENGTRIRLTGEGEAGVMGGDAGDLYIFVSVRPHKIFYREGNDILCKVPIKMTTASLGGAIEVPCIDGSRAKINIPAGTQGGNRFRLRDKGMSVMRSSRRGDMYVHAEVETPVKLSKKQKELLEEFDKISDKSSSPESSGFFSKVKDFMDGFSN